MTDDFLRVCDIKLADMASEDRALALKFDPIISGGGWLVALPRTLAKDPSDVHIDKVAAFGTMGPIVYMADGEACTMTDLFKPYLFHPDVTSIDEAKQFAIEAMEHSALLRGKG